MVRRVVKTETVTAMATEMATATETETAGQQVVTGHLVEPAQAEETEVHENF